MPELSLVEMWALMDRWQVGDELGQIMVGGAWAESGWDTEAEGDWRGAFPCPSGLFQCDRGGGAGEGWEYEQYEHNPPSEVMLRAAVQARQWVAQNLGRDSV